MRLYLMRHGAAVDHAPSGRDVDRSLTAEGRRVVSLVTAELLASLDRPIGRVLASPAERAQETAELVIAGGAALGPIQTEGELAVDSDPPVALARSLAGAPTSALIVGHQPWIEALARSLLAPGLAARLRGYPTAQVVGVEMSTAELACLIDPRQLGR